MVFVIVLKFERKAIFQVRNSTDPYSRRIRKIFPFLLNFLCLISKFFPLLPFYITFPNEHSPGPCKIKFFTAPNSAFDLQHQNSIKPIYIQRGLNITHSPKNTRELPKIEISENVTTSMYHTRPASIAHPQNSSTRQTPHYTYRCHAKTRGNSGKKRPNYCVSRPHSSGGGQMK